MDQINLSAWVGRTETTTGSVSASLAGQIHATLGSADRAAPADGAELPQLWHWCAFPPTAAMAELGRDGHPRLGGFLPPVRLDRRMWAGGDLRFHGPLHVGEPLTRQSTIVGLSEKQGGAGSMVFVTVEHAIHGAAGLAVTERQDIVYLAIPDSYRAPQKRPAPKIADFERVVAMSEPLLFRYSAVTFNAHRIHYDLPYATGTEHYPGLVVHGPLQATLLMQAATEHRGTPPDGFRFRGVHPMFHFEDLRLIGVAEAGGLTLCTASPEGHQGLQATATWEGTTDG